MKPIRASRQIHCLHKRFCFIGVCLFLLMVNSWGQQSGKHTTEKGKKYPAKTIDIEEQLQCFKDSSEATAYIISLCADVPNNKRPHLVAYKQQTGHVFLILQRVNVPGDTIQRVFGYYPKKGLPTLFFKSIKACIKDNSKREIDTKISRVLTKDQFDTVIAKAISLSRRIYHINKFNCYDYAVGIFNTVSPDNPLPLTYVRFPFPFGRGGSPVSMYKDFRKIKDMGAFWSGNIEISTTIAPVSTGRIE